MRHVAAYLLACLGGNENPTAADLEKIMGSVGVEANKEKINHILKELEGKSIEEVVAAGREKLANVGTSKMVIAEAQDVVRTSSPIANEPEQPQKEETEESDDDLGFGLFD